MEKKISNIIENYLDDINNMGTMFKSSMELIFSIQDGKLLNVETISKGEEYEHKLIYKTSWGLLINVIIKWSHHEDKYKVEKLNLKK